MDNTKNNNNETQSQYDENKYTIAVMGASGVGKTFFWASYFYSILKKQKKTKYKLTPVKGNNDRIDDLMKTIFINHKKVSGTEKVTDISFYININENEVKIDLEDVKGGDTTDLDHFKEELQSRLKHADGLMIFISAEDIMNSHDTIGDINAPFREAINVVRDYKLKKWWEFWQQKADIPVWFIFTKGDKIDPEIKEDKLKAEINFLLDSAKENHSSLYNLFNKGKNVKCFKVSAVGKKWDDIENVSVPVDATDDNITDAMDELFDAMYNARYSHNITLNTIWSSVATVLLIILFLADASYQKSIVSNLEKNVNLAVSSPNFNKDIYEQIKTKIAQTRNRFVFPEFLRNTEKIDFLHNKAAERLETFCYDKIKHNLDVDTNRIPNEETAKIADEVKEYLSYTDFSKINNEHYNKVKNFKPYFDFAVKLSDANSKALIESEIAEEAYKKLDNWLLDIKELPAEWLNELSATTDRLVHLWGEKISDDLDSKEYDSQIAKAEALLTNSLIPDEVKEKINKYVEKWNKNKERLLQYKFNQLLQEINDSQDVENAIKKLHSFEKENTNCPQNISKTIKEKLNGYYETLVENNLTNSNIGLEELRNLKQNFPDMPDDLKERIDSRIDNLIEIEISGALSGIDKSSEFDELDNAINEAEEKLKLYPEKKSLLSDRIFAKLQSLNEDKLGQIKTKANNIISVNAFKDAFDYIIKEYKTNNEKILSYKNNIGNNVDEIINNNKKEEEKSINELLNNEYHYCKNVFDNNKNIGGSANIQNVINVLEDYKTRIKDSDKIREIDSVIVYLSRIKNGFDGNLIIEDGDYSAISGIDDKPDIEITVSSINGKYSCYKEDQIKPNFNDSRSFNWTSDMGKVTFSAVEKDDISSDDHVFEHSISVNGFFGYKNLTTKIKSNGCTQNIRFDHNLPACPWE